MVSRLALAFCLFHAIQWCFIFFLTHHPLTQAHPVHAVEYTINFQTLYILIEL